MSKIQTTHVGSLPRSQDVADFVFTREREEPCRSTAFDACAAQIEAPAPAR